MDEIESQDVATEEATEEVEAQEADTTEEAATEEPKAEKPKETLEQKAARLERELKQTNKKLGKEEPHIENQNSGELSETQLDFLDLKGISEQEDIDVVQAVMKRTGLTLRQALQDDYVASKLKANKSERDVRSATPSSTKRGGGQSAASIDALVAKAERTGELPSDFETRAKVIDAITSRGSGAQPSWKR